MHDVWPEQRGRIDILRCGIGVEEDVPVLEILRSGSVLQVLLEGVTMLDGRDRGLING